MSQVKLVFEKRAIKGGETPQALFDHLRGEYAFLLESGKGGRYSYLGYDPFLVLALKRGAVNALQRHDFFDVKKSAAGRIVDGEPLEVLRDYMKRFVFSGKAPVPFYGGAAGFFSYDFGASLMDVEQQVFDDMGVPDFVMSFVDKVIAFDHEKGEVYFLALGETDMAAKRKIAQMYKDLEKPVALRRKGEMGDLQSNITKETYVEKIAQVKNLLQAGETYQVNFSQRFSAECTLEPLSVYEKLTAMNPSPFACYLEYPEMNIVSCSPELLLRKRGLQLETWPIKGTVKRGADDAEDEVLGQELLASEKNKAELTMIVDLERNDLGKVCDAGSVRVSADRVLEKYSHVIHTVSRVEGKLARRFDIFDALRAMFPGGSITGCPKKRTMEIIDSLEEFKRGVYTGSVGWINFSGDGDFNILIRTMFLKNGHVYFSAGGGIVIDSDAEQEYEESLQKAAALQKVLLNFI